MTQFFAKRKGKLPLKKTRENAPLVADAIVTTTRTTQIFIHMIPQIFLKDQMIRKILFIILNKNKDLKKLKFLINQNVVCLGGFKMIDSSDKNFQKP